MPAAFDYALGDCRTHKVWVTAKGVGLDPGDKHVGGLRIGHEDLANASGQIGGGGLATKTCVGIFLLRQGTQDLFKDGNVPNHDERYTVLVDRLIL